VAQAGFALSDRSGSVAEAERPPLSVSIFADRPRLRDELLEDVLAAGLRVGHCAEPAVLFGSEPIALGELVLIDCPQVDAARLAALSRLDMRIARSDAQLLVSTSIEALDEVFGCLDQSRAQILVAPGRAEWMVALGRVLSAGWTSRLRELSEEDRLQILRLTEEVERLGRQLSGFAKACDTAPSQPFLLGRDRGDNAGLSTRERSGGARPSLPDPRLVRGIVRQRQLRGRFFDAALFADPAWDILLDLTAARAEHARVSVSSLCIASGVPPTTALRWIGQMVVAGLLERQEDVTDRRRAFIALSDSAADAMARYFAELGPAAASLV